MMMMGERAVTDDTLFSLLLSLDEFELERLAMLDDVFDRDLCLPWSNKEPDAAEPLPSLVPPSPSSCPPSNCGAERLPGDTDQGQGLRDHGRPEQASTAYSNVRLHGQGRSEQSSTAYPKAPVGLGPETIGPDSYLQQATSDVDDSMEAKPKKGKKDSVRGVTRVSSGRSLCGIHSHSVSHVTLALAVPVSGPPGGWILRNGSGIRRL